MLDEAQAIKNPTTKMAKAVRNLKASHRLCLTGTPLENHLGELWSLYEFLMPGFLGDSKTFNHCYRVPIEKHRSTEHQTSLAKRLQPSNCHQKQKSSIPLNSAKNKLSYTKVFALRWTNESMM